MDKENFDDFWVFGDDVECGGAESSELLKTVINDQTLPRPGVSDFKLEHRKPDVRCLVGDFGPTLEDVVSPTTFPFYGDRNAIGLVLR